MTITPSVKRISSKAWCLMRLHQHRPLRHLHQYLTIDHHAPQLLSVRCSFDPHDPVCTRRLHPQQVQLGGFHQPSWCLRPLVCRPLFYLASRILPFSHLALALPGPHPSGPISLSALGFLECSGREMEMGPD